MKFFTGRYDPYQASIATNLPNRTGQRRSQVAPLPYGKKHSNLPQGSQKYYEDESQLRKLCPLPPTKQVNIVLESARVDYRPTMIKLTHVINIVAKELMGTINAVSRVREALGDTSAKKPPAIAAHVATTDGGDATGTVANGGEGMVTADQGAGEGAVAEGKGLGEGAVDLPVAQVHEGRVHVGFVVCVLVVCVKPGVACRTPLSSC